MTDERGKAPGGPPERLKNATPEEQAADLVEIGLFRTMEEARDWLLPQWRLMAVAEATERQTDELERHMAARPAEGAPEEVEWLRTCVALLAEALRRAYGSARLLSALGQASMNAAPPRRTSGEE